jgi:N-acyl-L-homoserine lactone synthetase
MIHIVTHANRHLYTAQLTEMHRQRAEIFVRTKGWRLQLRDGGEYDQGDDERAVYLLALDETGRVYGHIRLRPADDFSMLFDALPHFMFEDAHAYRRRGSVWEMARYVAIGEGLPQGEASKASAEIKIALLEAAFARGATEVVGACDVGLYGHITTHGWRFKPLGLPRSYPEGGAAIAFTLPVTVEEIVHARTVSRRFDPVRLEIPPGAEWSRLPLPVIEEEYRRAACGAAAEDPFEAAAHAALAARMGSERAA